MGITITHDLVIICEGTADKNFLEKLISERNLPHFDVMCAEGIGKVSKVLMGLRASPAFSNIKAIIIVADSGDSPKSTIKLIRKHIKDAKNYSLPAEPLKLSEGTPKIGILLIPGPDQAGGLESLCFEALVGRKTWLPAEIDNFLGLPNINALNWPAEKLAKAKFATAVAATFKRDPSRAVSWAFRKTPRQAPLLSVKSRAFNVVERWLRDFDAAARL
jgi:hypothetical protein